MGGGGVVDGGRGGAGDFGLKKGCVYYGFGEAVGSMRVYDPRRKMNRIIDFQSSPSLHFLSIWPCNHAQT